MTYSEAMSTSQKGDAVTRVPEWNGPPQYFVFFINNHPYKCYAYEATTEDINATDWEQLDLPAEPGP